MAFEDHALKSTSEKITLAWLYASERAIIWEQDGVNWVKEVSYYVSVVIKDNTSLIQKNSISLNQGEFYFNSQSGKIYIRLNGDIDPNQEFIRIDYKFFFSNKDISLPYDLDTGEEVFYQARLSSVSKFVQEIDNTDLIGISLENSGKLKMQNNDGFFDPIFDTLIWENKSVEIFAYSDEGKRILFKGIIKDKGYTKTNVSFGLKDYLYQLRNALPSLSYNENDSVEDSLIGLPRRIIYGQTSGLKLESISRTKEGYNGSGTISISTTNSTITGTSTFFLYELSPDDIIRMQFNGEEYTFTVATIISDTQFTISEKPEISIPESSYIISPQRPHSNNNRLFQVAGHKLRQPDTTISKVIQINKFELTNINDFFVNDIIKINGSELARIKSISGNLVILWRNPNIIPIIGDSISKIPINSLWFNGFKIPVSLWEVTNNDNTLGCQITLSNTLELVTTSQRFIENYGCTFTNGSRSVTLTAGNFESVRPRDWIKSDDLYHEVWYEILEVDSSSEYKTLRLRSPYLGTSRTNAYYLKSVDYISDDSILTVDCYGKEVDGKWIKTGPDAVRDILINSGITNINEQSFSIANDISEHVIDIKFPETPNAKMPIARDAITRVNEAVIGSLTNNKEYEMVYTILDASMPNEVLTVRDDDILSYSIMSNTDIIKTYTGRFHRFDNDIFGGDGGTKSYSQTSEFVSKLIEAEATRDREISLYNNQSAEVVTQRYLFYSGLTQSVVKLKGKLNLSLLELNDRIFLAVRRLFDRFAGDNSYRVYTISKIEKNGSDTSLTLSDLGNSFNRTARIAANDANDFLDSTDLEKIHNGYIVDDITELPNNNEAFYGSNLIG